MSDEVAAPILPVEQKPEVHPMIVAGQAKVVERVGLLNALKKQWIELEARIQELEKQILG